MPTTAGSVTDWGRLEHAYGPATDVPPLLEALRSADAATRAQALDGLEERLYHQGHRYDATLAALPQLLDVLRVPVHPDRLRLLDFLHHVAVQYPDEVVFERDRTALLGDASYLALRAAIGTVLGLLGDADEAVRAGALALLANVSPPGADELGACLGDRSPLVRGLALLALARRAGLLGDAHGLDEVRARARKGKGAERTLAAAALVQLEPSPETVAALIAALPRSPKPVKHFPFADGSLFVFALRMAALAPTAATDGGARLLAHLRGPLLAEDAGGWDLVVATPQAFFGDPLTPASPAAAWLCTTPAELTPAQRGFLAVLAERRHWDGNYFTGALESRGVPMQGTAGGPDADLVGLRRYLGLLPPSGFEVEVPGDVAGAPVAWPTYRWIRAVGLGAAPEAAFEEALVRLPAAALLEASLALCYGRADLARTPGYDAARLLALAVRALGRRGEVVADAAVPRILREAQEQQFFSLHCAFALAVAASRRLGERGRALPEAVDDHLTDILRIPYSAVARELARELVGRLPDPRRDALVGREQTGRWQSDWLGFVPAYYPSHCLDAWELLDLASDRAGAIARAVRTVRAWDRPLDASFRRRVLAALAALGPAVPPAIDAALAAGAAPGDDLLRALGDDLRAGR